MLAISKGHASSSANVLWHVLGAKTLKLIHQNVDVEAVRDEILRRVRFAGRQSTVAGEREVRRALRQRLLEYRLHQDAELFERAYGYIRQYY